MKLIKRIIKGANKRILRITNLLTHQLYLLTNRLYYYYADGKHVFFGYYDITPFSLNNKKILAMQIDTLLETPDGKIPATVGYYINRQNQFHKIGSTNAWCWQQGCRLQWYPKNVAKNHVFYNIFDGGHYKSVIQDIGTTEIKKKYALPLYDISNDGTKGLSLDFSRLQRLRPGYGYSNLEDITKGKNVPGDGGIHLMDMESGNFSRLIKYDDVLKCEPHSGMNDAEHYFNHLSFNPSGDLFLFFHLWIKDGKRFSRLFVSDLQANLKLINNTGMVSHYTWKNDKELLVFCDTGQRNYAYVLYNIQKGTDELIGKNVLKVDGHPNYTKANNEIITDTYPDGNRFQHLLSYRIKEEKVCTLISFFRHAFFSGEIRCDLHPRLSQDNKYICVDDEKNKYRCMKVLKYKN